jgi:hypothetical protein
MQIVEHVKPAMTCRNPYHFLEDVITTFISLAVAYGHNPPPELLQDGIEFVFTDGAGPGHYLEVHSDSLVPFSNFVFVDIAGAWLYRRVRMDEFCSLSPPAGIEID